MADPVSNADTVARNIVQDAMVKDVLQPTEGIRDVLRIAMRRLDDIAASYSVGNVAGNEILDLAKGESDIWVPPQVDSLSDQMQEQLVRIRCTQWFLSRLFLELSRSLDFEVTRQQEMAEFSALPFDCRSVLFNNDGSYDYCYTVPLKGKP